MVGCDILWIEYVPMESGKKRNSTCYPVLLANFGATWVLRFVIK